MAMFVNLNLNAKLINCARHLSSFKSNVRTKFYYVGNNRPVCVLAAHTNYNPNRCMSIFSKLFEPKSERKLKIFDDVPDHYELVYNILMRKFLLPAQYVLPFMTAFCVSLLFVTPPAQPSMEPFIEHEYYLMYVFATVAFTAGLHYIIQQFPVRIYRDPQRGSYVFVLYGFLPHTYKTLRCKAGEVKKLDESSYALMHRYIYTIRDSKRILLLENHFKRPIDMDIMLGETEENDEDAET